MGKPNVSAAKVAALFNKYDFRFVTDINKSSSPFARADMAKTIYGRGFVVCIIGHDVLIKVTDPQHKQAALRYAQNIVATRIRHHFDDEGYLRKLEKSDGDTYAQSVFGGDYLKEQNVEESKRFKTDLPGVSIETPFLPLRNVECCPEDISA